jgi:hypothetical protein
LNGIIADGNSVLIAIIERKGPTITITIMKMAIVKIVNAFILFCAYREIDNDGSK